MERMGRKHVLLQLGYTSKRRLDGIAAFAKSHDWSIAIEDRSSLPSGWTGDGALVLLRQRQPRVAAFARRLAARGIPVVDLSICHPEINLPRVVGDHGAIGRLAAEHFIERHFRHAAFFAKDWTNVEKLRLGGFRRVWTDSGREEPQAWVWRKDCSERRYDDWKALNAWLAAKLSAAPKPLALFAFNDNNAALALEAALAAGFSVPEEIAMLGVDDEALIVENQSVPLSSVRHDLRGIGVQAAALLDQLMEGGKLPKTPILVPPLGIAVRRSTDVVAVSSQTLRHALALIREHLSDSYGVSELAADLGVSRATLSRLFSAEMDSTPSNEFLRQRLARAKVLLATTDIPIKTIASECGFCDFSHLANVFRRETGTTPHAFRRDVTRGE